MCSYKWMRKDSNGRIHGYLCISVLPLTHSIYVPSEKLIIMKESRAWHFRWNDLIQCDVYTTGWHSQNSVCRTTLLSLLGIHSSELRFVFFSAFFYSCVFLSVSVSLLPVHIHLFVHVDYFFLLAKSNFFIYICRSAFKCNFAICRQILYGRHATGTIITQNIPWKIRNKKKTDHNRYNAFVNVTRRNILNLKSCLQLNDTEIAQDRLVWILYYCTQYLCIKI